MNKLRILFMKYEASIGRYNRKRISYAKTTDTIKQKCKTQMEVSDTSYTKFSPKLSALAVSLKTISTFTSVVTTLKYKYKRCGVHVSPNSYSIQTISEG